MTNRIKAAAVLAVMSLAGCDLPVLPTLAVAPTSYHDVHYYDARPLERNRANAWCGNNPGLAAKVPSCDSADTSDIRAWNRKMGFLK
jgi:hypothetical protein